ncbi:hypothetical protein Ahy_A06g027196 [Arachis hypogaea]|uniref:Uncharacterized protein n=2 Tax=Arachis hypogaea TaxID=3818 RepID=A0A445CMX3_ARAHY|nr:hypothetical protein Ahy_A06g027196 [Arachis hypogaea]
MMGTMCVIRTKRSVVKPAEETPLITLDLSLIDKIPVLRCDARTLHVFRHGPEAASVIREALSRALVPYYPLAGRLIHKSEQNDEAGCLQVQCSGDGAWFVEASTDCTLQSLHFFDDIQSIPYDLLLPDDVPQTEGIDPLVKMQVTQFGCGGFVIGLVFCHTICDGLGAAQFLNAVGELARGLHNPTIEPLWHRHFAPSPPPSPSPPPLPKLPPTMPSYKLEHATVDIPMHRINNLKQEFQRLTGLACSSFEIVAAGLWTSRARAIDFEPNAELKLVFFANCRQILDPPLPAGFYGNCFFPVTITASYESLRDASLFDVVKMIQDAKTKLPSEFRKYLKGDCGDDPFAPPLSYRTLFISEWGRLGFNQVDYGWGPPVHVVPIQGSSIIPVGIVGYMPLTLLPNKGIRLMTWCVEQDHRHPFLHQMHALMDI